MGKFNKQLHDDINQLKVLHAKKDKTDFKKQKALVMERHNISKATVYRELKKDVPGTYKTPKYDPPIREVTEVEKEQVRGMLLKQIPIEQIRSTMEKRSGCSYSWDRIDRIRSEIQKQPRGAAETAIEEKSNPAVENESPYGDVVMEFIGQVMKIKEMSPGSVVTVPLGKDKIVMNHRQVKEIQLTVANIKDSAGVDLDAVANIRTKHLCYQKIRLFTAGAPHTIKELDDTYSLLVKCGGSKAIKEDSIDFERIVEIVKCAKPKATRQEIVGFVLHVCQKHSGLNPAMMPHYSESKKWGLDWIEKNDMM